MSCTVEQDLTAYLDGELEVFYARQVQSHLATCETCQETEGLLKRTLAHLSAVPDFEPSPSIRRRVLERIDEEPKGVAAWLGQSLRPKLLVSSMGLAAAAVIAVAVSREPGFEMTDPGLFDAAANLEIAQDYEILGARSVDDLEVIQHLHELEVQLP